MPYFELKRVVHVSFSNSNRLDRGSYFFKYKGRTYKLVQNRSARYADTLMTHTEPTDEAVLEAYGDAAELLSALAWETDANIAFEIGRQWMFPARATLKDAKPNIHSFRTVMRSGRIGDGITHLPHIETEDQRKALALYREAGASNNEYLKFLFYWQVLSVRGSDIANADAIHARSASTQLHKEVLALPLSSRGVGHYFNDHCRNAIGHVRRDPGRPEIDLDSPEDRLRIREAAYVVRLFAQEFIRDDLQLTRRISLYKVKPGEPFEYIFNEPWTYQGQLVMRRMPKFKPLKGMA